MIYSNDLYLDVETYSSVNIKTQGAYKYTQSPDFEILILSYTFDRKVAPIGVKLTRGEKIPDIVLKSFNDPNVKLHAHNATFERLCLIAIGINIPIERWRCSAVKAATCGLPLGLDAVSKALELGEDAKDSKGKALINYFSVPVKATKTNGGRVRNFPHHAPEKFEDFVDYCNKDVKAEIAVINRLEAYEITPLEMELYCLDQIINDRGIRIHKTFAENALLLDRMFVKDLIIELKEITGCENPNSPDQLKKWLENEMKITIKSLSKDTIPDLLKQAGHGTKAEQVLKLRIKASRTSNRKYKAMENCYCDNGKGHGLFQFLGAMRTGRWAGRFIQLQNLPKNFIVLLDMARNLVLKKDFYNLKFLYDDVSSILSQLIRTSFIPTEGNVFGVSDFSAIEARVIAWLANEKWRLDVFKTHGRIYEASASAMFNVPLETIGKGSPLRSKGKVAELALGYQGSVGAMVQMGAADMGLTELEMKDIVTKWRKASPNIVKLWADIEKNAILAVRTGKKRTSLYRGITFEYDGEFLMLGLPSGRKLYYFQPKIITETKVKIMVRGAKGMVEKWFKKDQAPSSAVVLSTWEQTKLTYMGVNDKKQWTRLDTYGGKLVENIVQAIARDILADSMLRVDKAGFIIVMHVHDELVVDMPKKDSETKLKELCDIMSEPIEWAPGLPLAADGYLTEYYKKD